VVCSGVPIEAMIQPIPTGDAKAAGNLPSG
jgi:hypothetical protein